MIEKTFKTHTGKLKIIIPEKLDEVTLGQLIAMQNTHEMTDLDAISILSNVPVLDLKNITSATDLQAFNQQVNLLALQIKYLYNSDAIPAKIKFNIDGKQLQVNVIKNLSVEPVGAFMAARDLIADEIAQHIKLNGEDGWRESFNPSLTVCAQILAQYFYCKATGKPYHENNATEFYHEVKKLPVTDALPIARYFFLSYPNLSKPKTSFWQRLQLYLSKRPALKPLKVSAISTQ